MATLRYAALSAAIAIGIIVTSTWVILAVEALLV